MAGARRITHALPRAAAVVGAMATIAALLVGCTNPGPSPTRPSVPSDAPAAAGPVTSAAIERLDAVPCPPESAEVFQTPNVDATLCGTITVPLDHADPTRGSLELDVTLRDADAPRGVLLVLGGGPGGTARWMAALLPLIAPELAAAYQFIAMDPRGTGADALDCPAVQAAVGSSDIIAAPAAAIQDCAELLGERAALQSTSDTIADLELLRESLGIDAWVVDGTSYGTFVAQQYALQHPAAIRALVLDSLVPAAGVDPFLLSTITAVPGVLEEICKKEECGFDPAAALATVLGAGYPALPLINALVSTSVMDPTFTGVLPALESAAAGEASALDEFVARMHSPATAEPPASFSAAAHIATLCADTPMPWGGADTALAERAAPLAAALDALDPATTWPFPTTVAAEFATVDACLHWPVDAYRPPSTAEFPDVPVLILTGARDLSTPVANAQAALADIPSAVSVIIPDAGHAAQLRPAGIAAVTEFLLSLDAR